MKTIQVKLYHPDSKEQPLAALTTVANFVWFCYLLTLNTYLKIYYIILYRMNSDNNNKPKRGRPLKYSPEEREQAYKIKHRQVQADNYALHKEEKRTED